MDCLLSSRFYLNQNSYLIFFTSLLMWGCLNLEVKSSESLNSLCGNGTLDPSEECDDGNLLDEDGCSYLCLIEDICNGIDDDQDGKFDEVHFERPTSLRVSFSLETDLSNTGQIQILDQDQKIYYDIFGELNATS